MQTRVFNRRFFIVYGCIYFLLLLIFVRCVYLQIFTHRKYSELAREQQSAVLILEPRRGKIFDAKSNILATNLAAASVYAEPHHIQNFNETVNELCEILNLPQDFVAERLKQRKFFVWIKRKISKEEELVLKKCKINGVGFLRESKRYYPMNNLACHIIGFTDLDNEGLEGIELYYDNYLKGTQGYKMILQDALLRELSAFSQLYMPACDGYNITLTVDSIIQNITETALYEGMSKFKAKAAFAIVMNPYTGEILSMANLPDFNPNFPSQYPEDNRRNRTVCDIFEPGSVFKIITACAVIEESLVKSEDVFFCEQGAYKINGRVLHDAHPYGWLNFEEVIARSSNIGVVKIAQILGKEALYKYMKLFGFGSVTDVDVPGEINGISKPPSQWSKVSITAIPIGHEVGVTALQMVTAMSVIANGGNLVKPFILSKIEDDEGRLIKAANVSNIKRRVICVKTAKLMKKILKKVVDEGTGKQAALKDFTTAGKTGTAQKIEANGIYSHSKYLASFVGFAPVDNPKIAVCVMFDEPKPVYYGGSTAAPVFAKIVDAALKYLETK